MGDKVNNFNDIGHYTQVKYFQKINIIDNKNIKPVRSCSRPILKVKDSKS